MYHSPEKDDGTPRSEVRTDTPNSTDRAVHLDHVSFDGTGVLGPDEPMVPES